MKGKKGEKKQRSTLSIGGVLGRKEKGDAKLRTERKRHQQNNAPSNDEGTHAPALHYCLDQPDMHVWPSSECPNLSNKEHKRGDTFIW